MKTTQKSVPPETLSQAKRWDVVANRVERLGLCRSCASQYAWGCQIGFALSHPPCPSCVEIIDAVGNRKKPNGWRVLPKNVGPADTPKPSGAHEGRCATPARGIDGWGQCLHCGEEFTGFEVCHCSSCCMTFTGIRAFDAHRVGKANRRRCVDPATVGLIKIRRPHWTGWGQP